MTHRIAAAAIAIVALTASQPAHAGTFTMFWDTCDYQTSTMVSWFTCTFGSTDWLGPG